MTELLFYHLERARLEGVLPDLLEKTLLKGWRATVRTTSSERVTALDTLLWSYRDESFLPHGSGSAETETAEIQPIWITNQMQSPNNPEILFLVDGAEHTVDELGDYQRCVAIFDGHDHDAVADARHLWKSAKEKGHDVTYWKQSDTGKFAKQG